MRQLVAGSRATPAGPTGVSVGVLCSTGRRNASSANQQFGEISCAKPSSSPGAAKSPCPQSCAELRKSLGLAPCSAVIVEECGGELTLKPAAVLEIETYSDDQIAAWDREDRLSPKERRQILQRLRRASCGHVQKPMSTSLQRIIQQAKPHRSSSWAMRASVTSQAALMRLRKRIAT